MHRFKQELNFAGTSSVLMPISFPQKAGRLGFPVILFFI